MMKDQAIPGESRATAKDLLCLTLIWCLAVAIVNPVGDFPLDDDWSFGLAVQYFMQVGHFHPTGWTTMTLLTNVLWGALFCLPEGFSFTALRFSTLTASWLGILGTYWLVRKLDRSRSIALLAALSLAFNPLYFVSSNTFMTDVPCLTLMIFSAVFFLEYLKSNALAALMTATLFSLAAILSRQVGLAVPMAFSVAMICARGFKPRVLLPALAPALLGVLVLAGFQFWLNLSGNWPAHLTADSHEMGEKIKQTLLHPAAAFPQMFHSAYVCLVATGLFLSPLLFLTGPGIGRASKTLLVVAAAVCAALAGLLVFYRHAGTPFMVTPVGNWLSVWGLGLLSLADALFFVPNPLPRLPREILLAATLIGLIGGSLLLCRTSALLRRLCSRLTFPMQWDYEAQAGVFLLFIALIYLGPTLFGQMFDRYLIPLIPFLAGFLLLFLSPQALPLKSIRCGLMVLIILSFSLFSICGTRDYLAWNRSRWEALDNLMSREQVKPQSIDGGFEFNGFYLFSDGYQMRPGKSPWWVYDDQYLITFNPLPGYHILHNYPYTHWLPPYQGNIYVLLRDPAGPRPQ
jgi:hypothetical protein